MEEEAVRLCFTKCAWCLVRVYFFSLTSCALRTNIHLNYRPKREGTDHEWVSR
jgi:hypothetical protein